MLRIGCAWLIALVYVGSLVACSLGYLPLGGAKDSASESPNSGYRETILADGPIAYWRLADRLLPTARDEIGQHDGVYSAGVTLGVPGPVAGSSAARFGGTNSFMTVRSRAFRFNGRAPFTIDAWIQIVSSPGFSCVMSDQLVAVDGAPIEGWQLITNTSSKLTFSRKHGSVTEGATAPLSAGASFVHVAGTYDGTTIRLFVNGEPQVSAQNAIALDDRASDFIIAGDGAGHSCLVGDLAEVAIYGRALGLDALRRHYQAGAAQAGD